MDKLLELMPRLSNCKPAELVKILQTTLRQSGLLQLQLPNQVERNVNTAVFTPMKSLFSCLNSHFLTSQQIHRATATIIEPTGESDNPLRFTSGLVVALDIDATLEHIQDPQKSVKVQVGFKHLHETCPDSWFVFVL